MRFSRNRSGNILILSISLGLFLAGLFSFFVLAYTRIVSSQQEVLKATEAAVMAAAKSFSQVVIEDENFGFIGISDSAPTGIQTTAVDGFATPVRGINSLIATVRLDMIVADQLDDNTFRALARRDYQNLMVAKDKLNIELERLTGPGQKGRTKDGIFVSPYEDAKAAYEANQIRMTGEKSSLKPGSLDISLGLIANLPTNTNIPKPGNYSALQKSDQESGKYLAYKNIPYKGYNFVFAGIGQSTALVDHKTFQKSSSTLPYIVPTVVRCEVQHDFAGTNLTGKKQERTLKSVACARPGALGETHRFSGGMIFLFDNGPVAGLNRPADLFFNQQFKSSPVDLFQTVSGGDFPSIVPTKYAHPVTGDKNPMSDEVFKLALYDWVRRGGSKANLESLKNFFVTDFQSASSEDLHSFQWKADGTIDYKIAPGKSNVHFPLSEKQWRAVSGFAFASNMIPNSQNDLVFDCYVLDYVRNPGRLNGGRHAGQPLSVSRVLTPQFYDSGTVSRNTLFASKWFATFASGSGNGALRESYDEQNVAVLIRLHKRK